MSKRDLSQSDLADEQSFIDNVFLHRVMCELYPAKRKMGQTYSPQKRQRMSFELQKSDLVSLSCWNSYRAHIPYVKHSFSLSM